MSFPEGDRTTASAEQLQKIEVRRRITLIVRAIQTLIEKRTQLDSKQIEAIDAWLAWTYEVIDEVGTEDDLLVASKMTALELSLNVQTPAEGEASGANALPLGDLRSMVIGSKGRLDHP